MPGLCPTRRSGEDAFAFACALYSNAIIRGGVEAYGAGLEDKPEVVALSKADAVPKDELKKKARALKKVAGAEPLIVSAATGEGVPQVLRALAAEIKSIRAAKKQEAPADEPSQRWRP